MHFPSASTSIAHNPRLRFLNALRAGSKPIATFLGLPSFRTAQIVAQTGLDVRIPDDHRPSNQFDQIVGCNHRLRARSYRRRLHAQCDCRDRVDGCIATDPDQNDTFGFDQKSARCWRPVSDLPTTICFSTSLNVPQRPRCSSNQHS